MHIYVYKNIIIFKHDRNARLPVMMRQREIYKNDIEGASTTVLPHDETFL